MEKKKLSKGTSLPAAPSFGDIPAAKRDMPTSAIARNRPAAKQPLLIGGIVGFVTLGAIALAFWLPHQTRSASSVPPSSQDRSPESTNPSVTAASDRSDAANQDNQPTPSTTTASLNQDALLGHFVYQEAPQNELKAITADGRLKLRQAAAEKFQAMRAAARQSGVVLVPISGFRSVEEQNSLFFDIKAQRGQGAEKRAEVSAPPGYSEHHTGYAVDIGDGRVTAANLSPQFEKTAAFQWLQANAAYYSFELSFPQGNRQGVSYEPWHWRFVGDRQSLETFYKARHPS